MKVYRVYNDRFVEAHDSAEAICSFYDGTPTASEQLFTDYEEAAAEYSRIRLGRPKPLGNGKFRFDAKALEVYPECDECDDLNEAIQTTPYFHTIEIEIGKD